MKQLRSGRKAIPTTLQQLRGRRIRPDRDAEPVLTAAVPPMPAYMADDAYAVEEWQGLVADLMLMQVLTLPDGRALAQTATALADHRRLVEQWIACGFKSVLTQSTADVKGTIRTKVVENPLFRQLVGQKKLCDQLLSAFGLTPSSRSKVQVVNPTAKDEFAGFETSLIGLKKGA